MTDSPYRDPFGSTERRARYEYRLALDCIVPLLHRWGIDVKGMRVLDLGCGDGGLAVALAENGAECLGIDLSEQRIAAARTMAVERNATARFLAADVLRMDHFDEHFDLVILSEVVEHLVNWSNVESLLGWCREHLAPRGQLYVSFPPWFSPYAGHHAGWPGIRYLPWYHLLPDTLKRLLVPRHAPGYIAYSQELNHLTIRAFERMARRAGWAIHRRELYYLRPEYYWRYKLPVVRSPALLASIPIVREITTTGAFYLLAKS